LGNFNIRDDNEKIKTGQYFWCSTHLGVMLVADQSPDPRYCQFCYDLLNNEVRILKETRQYNARASLLPKVTAGKPPAGTQPGVEAPVKRDKKPIAVADVETDTVRTSVILSHRGRNKKSLPVERIKELAASGASSRDIAKKLELDGVMVSYRTVSRALAGVK
jgi:hypothetical protein